MPGFTLAPGADAATVAAAQAELERGLGGVPPGLSHRVMIVAGEIAANAVEHGRGAVTVAWTVAGGAVRLDVLGPGPDVGQIRAATLPPDDAVRGRGLFLIQALATSVDAVQGGLRLRFEPDKAE